MKGKIHCDLTARIMALISAAFLLLAQMIWLMPVDTQAETAGDELIVRVQYYGELADKIREKARFSREELEAMGAQTWYYTNITRVGTVMSMAAHGPEVLTIIEASGIDIGSIGNITFRTTDGYTRNFTVERHLTAEKYYYPYLASCYERNEEGNALTPTEGATEGKQVVPAILALEFGESKRPGVFAEDLEMGTDRTYRFCMGQSDLTEGRMTDPSDGGGDISSMESCHSIYGIDVTLTGSPIKGMSLDIDDPDVKVGSMKRVSAMLSVDEAFDGAFTAEDITWSSSDESIATVNAQGEVTFLAEGSVTITATAPDGTTAQIVLRGIGEEKEEENTEEPAGQEEAGSEAAQTEQPPENAEDNEETAQRDNAEDSENKESENIEDKESEDTEEQEETEPEEENKDTADTAGRKVKTARITDIKKEDPEKDPDTPESKKEDAAKTISGQGQTIHAREIVLGDVIVEEASLQDEMRDKMAEDAAALDEARTYSRGAAAGTAAGAGIISGAGAIGRVLRYRRDFGKPR